MGLDASQFDYTITFPNGMVRNVSRLAAVLILSHRSLAKYPNASEDASTSSVKTLLVAVDRTPPEQAAEHFTDADGFRVTRYTPPA